MNQTISPRKKMKLLRIFWFVFIASIVYGAGFLAAVAMLPYGQQSQCYTVAADTSKRITKFDDKLYAQVYSLIRDKFVKRDSIDDSRLFYGAVRGMVEAVGDPYTVFFDPKENNQFNEELAGSFDGIGAELGIKDENLVIIAPLADSPAEKAGLRAGDVILAIDAKQTTGMSTDQAVSLIRGKRGTSVVLSIYRQDANKSSVDIRVTRGTIVLPTVKVVYRDSIAIVSLYNFNSESDKQMMNALLELQKKNITGIVLDLRNNPGGYLDKSINIASAWIPTGSVVVKERYQDPSLNQEHKAIKQVRAPQVPLIVLVNEGSASASEILAGALQDYGIAQLVGTKTYGKGSVQDVQELPDGSGLKITVAEWLTPKDRAINNQGIKPDVEVKLTKEDIDAKRDAQLDKALELLTKKK